MRKLTFTLLMLAFVGLNLQAQDSESYTALKATGDNIPRIDGTIDEIWKAVTMVPLNKVPEESEGVVHSNITEPDPDPTDFSAEIGMLWTDLGIYFLFSITDDIPVIYEDYDTGNDTPADKWWWDDNVNILFSSDLVNENWKQWEFAWQYMIDQEEKLSSDDWLNAAVIDIGLVESVWHQDENTYTLETFIDWEAFTDFTGTITDDMDIYLEARARDDDDDGVDGDSWESMFQWSTTRYGVESDGVGMGVVTLSSTEVEPLSKSDFRSDLASMKVYPNPAKGSAKLQVNLKNAGPISVQMLDITGKTVRNQVFDQQAVGESILPLNVESLPEGVYFLKVEANNNTEVLKLVIE